MEVVTFTDAAAFRDCADPLLLHYEARNNLILGVTGVLLTDPGAFDGFRSWVVIGEGAPLAAGIVAGDNNIIVADARSKTAVGLLAECVDDIPGAIGPLPWIAVFVSARPEQPQSTMSQGIYFLEEVAALPEARGRSRPAEEHHTDTIVDWFLAFHREGGGSHREDSSAMRRSVMGRIATQSPDFGVWIQDVDDRPVSMSCQSGPTPNGIRVSAVYTPPEHRRQGYASALVARHSRWLLDNGHRYCFLYTDLANPTSNAIYRRIGYRQIAESREYTFSP